MAGSRTSDMTATSCRRPSHNPRYFSYRRLPLHQPQVPDRIRPHRHRPTESNIAWIGARYVNEHFNTHLGTVLRIIPITVFVRSRPHRRHHGITDPDKPAGAINDSAGVLRSQPLTLTAGCAGSRVPRMLPANSAMRRTARVYC